MIRRRSKWWVWIIGLPIIIGAGAHWGLYFFTKYKLDTQISKVSSEARISYQNLVTDLRGKITVSGITVLPHGQKQPIKIDRVGVTGPNAIELLKQYNPLTGSKGAPFFLRMDVLNARLELTPELVQMLDQQQRQSLIEQGRQWKGICEPGGSLSFGELYQLGYKELQLNLQTGYHFIKAQRKLQADLKINLQNMWDFQLDAALDGVNRLDMSSALGWFSAALRELTLVNKIYPSLGRRISAYCADQSGLTVLAYEATAAERFLMNLEQQGVTLSRSLQNAVRDYFTNWGALELHIKPAQPMPLMALMQLKSGQLKRRLGLSLRINNRLIRDMDIHMEKAEVLQAPTTPAPKKSKSVKKPPRVYYDWVYQSVSIAALPAYLDHNVSVKTVDGVNHHGILVDVDNEKISVQKTLSGGKFIAHIQKAKVASVKVRVKVKREAAKSR